MRLRVRHRTTYRYGQPVDMATHMLHLSPRPLPHQRVLHESLSSTPAAARVTGGLDHFGNRTAWMFLNSEHERFEVLSEATVEVRFPDPPAADATPAWESVAALAPRTADVAEFLFPSPMVEIGEAARDFAAASFPPGRPVLAGLLDLNGRFRREFAFRSGVTTIATPVEEVLRRRQGVCQDFSHVMIAGLRALGLPARYVSGYLRTYPPPGQPKRQGADMSHAWVGAWLGPEHGWVDLDPTNDLVVREEHVVLGWGRDFGDVSPLRGVILGGGRHSLDVAVDLEPVEG
ncbi:transglutaminase family protein [Roseomonas sp. BN140053]|uniref:transglutaminase family protein n=1 Tax=Roseomonas sp. BN140053 TaxID=3391898 RepID=UPI0039E8ACF2